MIVFKLIVSSLAIILSGWYVQGLVVQQPAPKMANPLRDSTVITLHSGVCKIRFRDSKLYDCKLNEGKTLDDLNQEWYELYWSQVKKCSDDDEDE